VRAVWLAMIHNLAARPHEGGHNRPTQDLVALSIRSCLQTLSKQLSWFGVIHVIYMHFHCGSRTLEHMACLADIPLHPESKKNHRHDWLAERASIALPLL
jgi:hypothetical protein